MTLSDILRADAARMHGVTVTVNSAYSTVCISDNTGVQDDIFMQGHDADEFIAQRDHLYKETGDLGLDVIELHLAHPYTENLWN